MRGALKPLRIDNWSLTSLRRLVKPAEA